MIFKRRDPAPLWRRARELLAPRKGWRRGYLYLGKRMQRLPDTPHRIALGFACGVQASFTPFFGFHFVLAAMLAFLMRGNLIASALGTFVGNPLTFPFIAGSAIYMGGWITGIHVMPPVDDHYGFGWLWDNVEAIFVPYLVGGLLPGLGAAIAFYWTLRPLVAAYQDRRRARLMARAKERLRAAAARRARAREAREARKTPGGASDPAQPDAT